MPSVRRAVRLAGTGYAIPGTVLALGLLLPLAALDNWIADLWRGVFGRSPGLLVTGSITILILAYLVRFLAVAQSTVEAGFERLSPNLEPAARALGSTRTQALWRVELPLLIPTLGAAALLVFVDTMKELPATLLLRPFGIETLATTIYASASLEAPEQGAMAALLIVLAGLAPVLLLQRTMRLGRAG
jgi:iron(III) transport system permease protein